MLFCIVNSNIIRIFVAQTTNKVTYQLKLITMSTMRNSVMLVGRAGAEPQIKEFNENKKVARFNIAVNESYKNDNNEWVNSTQWFPIVAWDKMAERVEAKVKKGCQVAIDGKLRVNEWTDDKGQRHSNTEIWIEDLMVIESKEN